MGTNRNKHVRWKIVDETGKKIGKEYRNNITAISACIKLNNDFPVVHDFKIIKIKSEQELQKEKDAEEAEKNKLKW